MNKALKIFILLAGLNAFNYLAQIVTAIVMMTKGVESASNEMVIWLEINLATTVILMFGVLIYSTDKLFKD